jgi:hypothetical protein
MGEVAKAVLNRWGLSAELTSGSVESLSPDCLIAEHDDPIRDNLADSTLKGFSVRPPPQIINHVEHRSYIYDTVKVVSRRGLFGA